MSNLLQSKVLMHLQDEKITRQIQAYTIRQNLLFSNVSNR